MGGNITFFFFVAFLLLFGLSTSLFDDMMIIAYAQTVYEDTPIGEKTLYENGVGRSNGICDGLESLVSATDLLIMWVSSMTFRDLGCSIFWVEYDISSIDDNAKIVNTEFITTSASNGEGTKTCAFIKMPTRPSTLSNKQALTDVVNGTVYLSTSECIAIGSSVSKTYDLGDLADQEIKTRLTSGDWFGIGGRMTDPNSSDTIHHSYKITKFPTLKVTYYIPCTPNIPTTPSYGIKTSTAIPVLWRAPGNCTMSTTELQHNVDGTGWSTIYSSTPKTSHTDTGLTPNESYDYRVRYQSDAGDWGNYLDYTPIQTLNIFPPIITLTGYNPQYIISGNGYNELGAFTDDGSNVVIDSSSFTDAIGSYSITYDSSNASGDAVQKIRTVNVVYTLPPVITLTGDNPQIIEFGNGYNELGAFTDDGSSVIINSSSFTDTVNSYFITYDSSNASGDAVQKIRTVNVVDTTPPIITLTGYNPQYIISGNGYNELGAFTDDGSNVVIDSSSFTDAVNSYFITYDSVDLSNNNAVQKIRTVTVYSTGNFTTGNLSIDELNPLRINPISFSRTDVNNENQDIDNSVLITVNYPASFDLDCEIKNKFSNTTQNYTNMTGQTISTGIKQLTFDFTNYTNEVITMYCYDSITGEGSTYVITNNDFPMLEIFDSFRDGTFGTFGKIGEIDLITLIVIIVSMIGFNRKNPVVGVMINVMVVGATAYLGIIQWYTVMISVIATTVMFVIFSGRNRN